MNRAFALAFVASLLVATIAATLVPALRPTGLLRDFSAFYCAGSTLDRGRDPYRAEPLGTCERLRKPAGLYSGIPGLVTPAPLPPFALAGFALFARRPYPAAATLWTLVLGAAVVGAIRTLVALGVDGRVAALALVPGAGYAELALGQVVPLAILALVLAARACESGRSARAGVLVALASIEPHLGLPAALALALARPAARLPLALGLVALVALGVAAAGPAVAIEYVTAVLPAHAASEIANSRQLSLTYVLAAAGVPARTALTLGDLSFALTTVVGVAAGRRLARRYGAALIVLTPVAFAVLGGPFVHIAQTVAALPAALLLGAREPRLRALLLPATLALAIPWIQFASLGGILVPVAALAAGGLAWLGTRRLTVAAAAALGSIALLAAVDALVWERVADPLRMLASTYDPHELAEASWGRYVAVIGTANRAAYDLAKLPTWSGLLAFAAAALLAGMKWSGASGANYTSSRP